MNIVKYSSKEELDNYIRHNYDKALGIGREGACFLMPDGYVIKSLYSDRYYEEWLRKFEGVQIPGFVFANGGVLIDDIVKALFMDYASGKQIHEVKFEKCPIEMLRSALERLKENITALSNLGIKIDEYYYKNILFDGSNFALIDTQGYEYDKYPDTYTTNLTGIMREVFIYVFGGDSKVYEYSRRVAGFLFLYNNDLLTHPELLLDDIREDYYRRTKEYMNTLEDARLIPK